MLLHDVLGAQFLMFLQDKKLVHNAYTLFLIDTRHLHL